MDQAVNQTLNNRNRKSVNADKIQESLRLENLIIQRPIIRKAQKKFTGQNLSHAVARPNVLKVDQAKILLITTFHT